MKNDPTIIKAKFESKCAETGAAIKKGDDCIYYPATKFDIDCLNANY